MSTFYDSSIARELGGLIDTLRGDKAALKDEIERTKNERDQASKSYGVAHGTLMDHQETVIALKKKVESLKIDHQKHLERWQDINLDYSNQRDALALALKDAREALDRIKTWAMPCNPGEPRERSLRVIHKMSDEALSRTSDPSALLEAHDKEKAAEIYRLREALRDLIHWAKPGKLIFSMNQQRSHGIAYAQAEASLRPSTEAGERKP